MNDQAVVVVPLHEKHFAVILKEASDLLVKAQEYAAAIKDQASFEAAATFQKNVKTIKKTQLERLEAIYGEDVTAAQGIVDRYNEKRKTISDLCDQPVAVLAGPLGAWYLEQERLRKQEEARRSAEAKRLQDEAAINAAQSAEAAGNAEKAAQIIEKAAIAPAPTVKLQKTSAGAGIGFPTYYGIDEENIDFDALLAAIAGGKCDRSALVPDLVFLRGQARLLKDKFDGRFPGVRLVKTTKPR